MIVVDETLPLGQLANAVAVLTASMGKKHLEIMGYDLKDSNGNIHSGITTLPLPILKAGSKLAQMRTSLFQHPELSVVDVISATSTTRSYDEYADMMKTTPAEKLNYYGVAIYGAKKLVNQYTGSLGLLR